jgi:polysaccharide biosynthesis/export protein
MGRSFTLVVAVLFIFLNSSCVNTKKAVYFNDVPTSVIPSVTRAAEPIIEVNDILSISVSSINPEATNIFNSPNATAAEFVTLSGGVTRTSGYLVSTDGYIQFPMLGTIKAAGLPKKALADTIANQLVRKQLLFDPIVNIRYMNFKVTVLGEVQRPSVIPVVNERISLLEAIGLAGDLTIYARRDNVMVLREEDNMKIVQRINLNSPELLTSPYYYLKSNDVVYVEPNRERVVSGTSSSRWINTALASVSILLNILFFALR